MGNRNQHCTTFANEPAANAARAVIDRALGFPKPPIRVGEGPWGPIPETWDGVGDCPPGWASSYGGVVVGGTVELPLPDSVVEELQTPQAQARMTPGERGLVTAWIASRTLKNLTGFVQREANVANQRADSLKENER